MCFGGSSGSKSTPAPPKQPDPLPEIPVGTTPEPQTPPPSTDSGTDRTTSAFTGLTIPT